MSLFNTVPLAESLRPKSLDAYFFAPGSQLAALFELWEKGLLRSFVLQGPSGVGKTSALRIFENLFPGTVERINAVDVGIKELRSLIKASRDHKASLISKNVECRAVIIDEIHRLTRSQQDILLPALEDGSLILMSATTENLGSSLISAFLSRLILVKIKPLTEEQMEGLLRAGVLALEIGPEHFSTEIKRVLLDMSFGDGRVLISNLEKIKALFYDKQSGFETRAASVYLSGCERGRSHEAVRAKFMSALIKSMRASQYKASVFYLGCLLKAKEDPAVIYRRLMVFASEDIGVEDPGAIQVISALWTSFQLIGMPEGSYGVFQAVSYLAKAVKSRKHVKQINWCTSNIGADFESYTVPSDLGFKKEGPMTEADFLPNEFLSKIK